jgi:NADH:ubiquinone oxidoreductase subunit F (NADH-binding)
MKQSMAKWKANWSNGRTRPSCDNCAHCEVVRSQTISTRIKWGANQVRETRRLRCVVLRTGTQATAICANYMNKHASAKVVVLHSYAYDGEGKSNHPTAQSSLF